MKTRRWLQSMIAASQNPTPPMPWERTKAPALTTPKGESAPALAAR